jgi:hypothetical protein
MKELAHPRRRGLSQSHETLFSGTSGSIFMDKAAGIG